MIDSLGKQTYDTGRTFPDEIVTWKTVLTRPHNLFRWECCNLIVNTPGRAFHGSGGSTLPLRSTKSKQWPSLSSQSFQEENNQEHPLETLIQILSMEASKQNSTAIATSLDAELGELYTGSF